ncbi:MAG: TatD family hydrolase [Zetaproteobacteria bacterium]|nr:TatD family hydrolase [Zetaproteobacteria bacterium]
MSKYVDVHTHLTDTSFDADRDAVIEECARLGLEAVVVNGTEPQSNRMILELAEQYPHIQPALGIYPVEAVHELLPVDYPRPTCVFDVAAEIEFIEAQAAAKTIVAVGECGLDGYCLEEQTYVAQEKVLEALVDIGIRYDIPVILHTRKRERRCLEMMAHLGVQKADFHCYGGRTKLAIAAAEKHGWCFSIPSNVQRNEAHQKLLKSLPPECILTETDAPYLAPERGTRNWPGTVIQTVELLASLRGWHHAQAADQVWQNYSRVFVPQG